MNRRCLLTMLLPAAVATAQGVTLEAWTFGGGGAFTAAGNVELGGTLGAPAGGWQTAGTTWSTAGFWGALEEPPSPTAIAQLTALPGPERILLQWRAGTLTGWVVDRRTGIAPFARIGMVGASATASYRLLDTTPVGATPYTYLLSEQVAGSAIPRATIDATAYGLTLPPNVVRVGPRGLASVQTAIAAAPAGAFDWVVTLEPGTYGPFTVDATSPAGLRIVADGTGPVHIDTQSGPVRIAGRLLGQTTELHGLDIGSPATAQNGLEIADSADVVLVQHTTIAADTTHVALDVRRSGAIALHRCDLSGKTGLLAVTARIAAGRTRTAGFDLSQSSRLTAAELDNTGTAVVDPTSQFGPLAGVMPEVGGPVFAVPDVAMTLLLETPPNAAWAVIVAARNSWLELPPFVQMPVLLDLSLSFTVASGIADPQGHSTLPVLITGANAALFGASLPFQMLSIDAQNSVLRMSNAATRVWLR